MKKHIALLLACSLSLAGFAQEDDKKFQLGFIAQSSFGWITPESKNITGGGLKPGIGLGVYGDYFFAKNYALSLEVQHTTQGFKLTAANIMLADTSGSTNTFRDVNINYRIRSFQVPVSIKLRTNNIGNMRYYGQVGLAPTFAYKTIKADYSQAIFTKKDAHLDRPVNDASNDFLYTGSIPVDEEDQYLEEDNISGIRIPILVGMGAEWDITPSTALLFGVRYEYGLTNMMKAENTEATRNVLGLLVGVRF